MQAMNGFVGTVKGFERLRGHESLPDVLALPPSATSASTCLQVGTVISATRDIAAARIGCDAAVAASFRELGRVTAEVLADLRPIVEFAAAFDAAAYKSKERSFQQLRTDFVLLRCAVTEAPWVGLRTHHCTSALPFQAQGSGSAGQLSTW